MGGEKSYSARKLEEATAKSAVKFACLTFFFERISSAKAKRDGRDTNFSQGQDPKTLMRKQSIVLDFEKTNLNFTPISLIFIKKTFLQEVVYDIPATLKCKNWRDASFKHFMTSIGN